MPSPFVMKMSRISRRLHDVASFRQEKSRYAAPEIEYFKPSLKVIYIIGTVLIL